MTHHFKSLAAVAAVGFLVLTGCSQNDSSNAADQSDTAEALTVENSWAKAADSGMTAVFGEITNNSDQAVTITGASSNATDAENTQLHTTALDASSGSSQMKQVDSMTIEAGQTLTLEPGGDHIMLMDLTCSLPAGTPVHVTLETESGQELTFDAGARDYSGAQEEYAPGEMPSDSSESEGGMDGMEGMEHSDMSDMPGMATESAAALPQCS